MLIEVHKNVSYYSEKSLYDKLDHLYQNVGSLFSWITMCTVRWNAYFIKDVFSKDISIIKWYMSSVNYLYGEKPLWRAKLTKLRFDFF